MKTQHNDYFQAKRTLKAGQVAIELNPGRKSATVWVYDTYEAWLTELKVLARQTGALPDYNIYHREA